MTLFEKHSSTPALTATIAHDKEGTRNPVKKLAFYHDNLNPFIYCIEVTFRNSGVV